MAGQLRVPSSANRGFVSKKSQLTWLGSFRPTRLPQTLDRPRPFSRAHLDRIELPADWRDLLVRSRATASRAELVSARPFSAAAIWYGSSPGAERQVLWGLRLSSDVDLVVTRWTTRSDRASVGQAGTA